MTVVYPKTRYPEAFPLKKISSKTILQHLVRMFTTGIPQEVQSNRGTNLTSEVFEKVFKELDITQTLSTAYHLESQGALERWHQTVKSMLHKYCCENQECWDKELLFMLFAIREATHESLGFSPFELLFGRKVGDPLKLVKDKWINSSGNQTSVSTYLENLKNTICKVRLAAKSNLLKAQTKMKSHFDKNSKIKTSVKEIKS